jgi:glycosyltransferase involved in cell wall biosynthesis
MATVGLVMIVKDEEAVIERALLSARPFISTYMIVDTGSTDRTKEIIQQTLADLSGQIIDRPWVSFGHNRSEALALCDGHMDWAIMLDADDTIEGRVPPPSGWAMAVDAFMLQIKHGSINHIRHQIFRTDIGWAYEGTVHEYAVCRTKKYPVLAVLPSETYMNTRCEGSRSKDPNKYLNDARLLEVELAKDPHNARTLFYLAQSYRDAGHIETAVGHYRRYMDLSGCGESIQERYVSLLNLISLVQDQEEKLRLTWTAIDLCPDRLDAPYLYLKQRREEGLPVTQQCYAVGSIVKNRTISPMYMFAMPAVYEWGMDDELAIVAFATGHYREAYEASTRCMMTATTADMRANAAKNAKSAYDAMQ